VTWVAWQQHRREAAVASLTLALIAAFLVFEWIQMSSAYSQLGLGSCQVNIAGTACGDALNSFQSFYPMSVIVRYVLIALPGLLGVFVAAPLLAREVEQGTQMFIWTQSITRTRWFAIKVILLGSFTGLMSAALGATATWWHEPLDVMFSDGAWTFFDVIGPVPVAYAFFALALGLAVGTVLPRTVPAMATTLLLFVATRVAVYFWRPWFLDPLTKQLPTSGVFLRGALQISQGGTGPQTVFVYQPADRFWTFQAIETGIFLFLAVLLISFSAWWLRHRIR
jgi:hypothetical protein